MHKFCRREIRFAGTCCASFSYELHRGLKRNIFTLNIHYSPPIFHKYSLFLAYFEINIHLFIPLNRLMFPGIQFSDPQNESGQIFYSNSQVVHRTLDIVLLLSFWKVLVHHLLHAFLMVPSSYTFNGLD